MFGMIFYMSTRKVIVVVTIFILTKCAFTVDSESGRVCSKLVPNPHSWHRDASLLYIDSPVSEPYLIGAIPNFATEKEPKRNFLDFTDVTLVEGDVKF